MSIPAPALVNDTGSQLTIANGFGLSHQDEQMSEMLAGSGEHIFPCLCRQGRD